MLTKPTLERLRAMRLRGMADAFAQQMEDPTITQLSFEERFGLLVDHQWLDRQNRALERRLKVARFGQQAALEDIDYKHPRGLDRSLVASLSTSEWVAAHLNLIITGPCGVGKSYLGCAFAQKAVRDGFTALYARAVRLFRDLGIARADGSLQELLRKISCTDVLIVDDWAMHPMSEAERRDFLEISEERYQRRSTILTSQFAIRDWHNQIGDPTIADSILDRLVHNAYRIELKGESLRKTRSPKGGPKS
jgi:DNA replication protein DnaC